MQRFLKELLSEKKKPFVTIVNDRINAGIRYVGNDFKLLLDKDAVAISTKRMFQFFPVPNALKVITLLNGFNMKVLRAKNPVAKPDNFRSLILKTGNDITLTAKNIWFETLIYDVDDEEVHFELIMNRIPKLYKKMVELGKFTNLPVLSREAFNELITRKFKQGLAKPPFVIEETYNRKRKEAELIVIATKDDDEEGIVIPIKRPKFRELSIEDVRKLLAEKTKH